MNLKTVGFDSQGRPLVTKPSGFEELDRQEILRQRYSGWLPGEPDKHFLGGNPEVTFGDTPLRERWERVKNVIEGHPEKAKSWREAYSDIGLVSSHMGLSAIVRDEVARAFANLKRRGLTERRDREVLLGHLTYLACKIQRYPRSFKDVQKAFKELFGLELHNGISKEVAKAFNYRQVKFGLRRKNGKTYLRRWEMVSKKINDTDLGIK